MDKNELISIIVPVYNVENYLTRCVESIINQTYNNIQIILVDDGSNDSSSRICDELAKKDKRIDVVHKKNGGLSDARNKGIEIAKGKILSFIDSDDWIEKSMINDLYQKMKTTNSDISIGGRYRAFKNKSKKIEKYSTYPEKDTFDNVVGLKYLMSFCGYDMSVCDKLFKRELFEEIRFPFGKTCEDYFTTYKIFSLAQKICYLDKPLYNYYFRENSISRNKKINETSIEATLEQYNYINSNFSSIISAASSSYITAYMSVYNEYIIRKRKCEKLRKYKIEAKKHLKTALKNDCISNVKKIQMIFFCYFTFIYKIIIKRKKGNELMQ